jgi:acetylornithine deacetylase/succinyl-diaminopimelate desuccinylase-like protein
MSVQHLHEAHFSREFNLHAEIPLNDSRIDTELIDREWEKSAIPELIEYAKIPNISPAFDPDWQNSGHMDAAVARFSDWSMRQQIPGFSLDVLRAPGRTPLLFAEVAGDPANTLLLYGHLDKQPEMSGWRAGLGPWLPVIEGDRFYARGVADDGYALFAYLIAIRALISAGQRVPRCVLLIEACEESGSQDLPFYMQQLAPRIGRPALVICLDASCGDYERAWCTTSLRGFLNAVLRVDILSAGVHSGDASGIVPSSFRILRQVLDRIEDAASGRIIPEFLNATPPPRVRREAADVAAALGDAVHRRFPFVTGAHPVSGDPVELILGGTWNATLSITGADGLPPLTQAGNVLRPHTALKLSFRLPPGVDAGRAGGRLKALLESEPPYGAKVRLSDIACADGWRAPDMSERLKNTIEDASQRHFGKPAAFMGDGGSIPFMSMLGQRYPDTQFLITGILGPGSNAHGPDEFMHIPTVKKITCCVAEVMAAYAR